MEVVPYKEKDTTKKEQVQEMFDNIAPKYDLLNRVLSMGIDILWRKKLISKIVKSKPNLVLDVATGTADVAIEIAKSLKPSKIIGLDLSDLMLNEGRKKIKDLKLEHIIELVQGDSENLKFPDNTFDAITVAFGVRNFENLEKGLFEMQRVLKPGATIAILEFSKPQNFPVKQLYKFYFNSILPKLGKWVSKDSAAYTYLPESVQNFPQGKEFLLILEKTGYKNCQCTSLTFGISSIYSAQKQ
ncbi:MAG: bifunctional demethylmenaquinone methyltransferase/2-methoxy-6-polyprenyl-1,4-benzoquinol methylase UbiE [Opitutaceae bacterium]|nr:bifunctional demethylmenaquinone methyltransferase/2-methoxy-6-polyprenyl-1,4-benzoquinol methylase UbiE [Cytophagales bacterium]